MEPQPPTPAHAALSRRAVAFVLDFAIFVFLWLALVATLGRVAGLAFPYDGVALALAYMGFLPATHLQGTPGKRLLGIRITDLSGRRLGLARSIVRAVVFLPSIGIAGAGFLLAAFTARRQALHDLAAGTVVVTIGASPEEVAQRPATISWMNRVGLALSLALVVLAIHTFVQVDGDRQARTRATDLLNGALPYQEDVAQALKAGAGMPAASSLPKHARSMAARPDGTIVIEIADHLFPGGRVLLRPLVDPKGKVTWTCAAENVRPALLPSRCRP